MITHFVGNKLLAESHLLVMVNEDCGKSHEDNNRNYCSSLSQIFCLCKTAKSASDGCKQFAPFAFFTFKTD